MTPIELLTVLPHSLDETEHMTRLVVISEVYNATDDEHTLHWWTCDGPAWVHLGMTEGVLAQLRNRFVQQAEGDDAD